MIVQPNVFLAPAVEKVDTCSTYIHWINKYQVRYYIVVLNFVNLGSQYFFLGGGGDIFAILIGKI